MATPVPEYEKTFWKFEEILDNLEMTVTSWFTTPLVLLIVRSIFLIYSLITLALSIYDELQRGRLPMYLTCFTNLGFIGLTAYFTMAVIHSLTFVVCNEPKSLSTQPRLLTIAFWILYHTIIVYHILIPIVYWAILVPSHTEESPLLAFHEISMHGVNFFMMIVEVALNRIPLVASHLIFVLTILILYIFETWMNNAINSEPSYILVVADWREIPKGMTIILPYLVMIGIAIGAFLIQALIHTFRDAIGRRIWRKHLMQEMETVPRIDENRQGIAISNRKIVRTSANIDFNDIEMQAR
ncbi:1391_t:CDS:2 [Ambispora leptoticha]|uniref:1391_t:CDS:1 n=1 Tax=Ambispora leptoticha TaxID=144679 RepID=A0A9N8ZYD7_9GLOM|nr:1391_t:CDS:2 [Ambispora leptoticha]